MTTTSADLFITFTDIPDKENEFIINYGQARYSSLLENAFSPFVTHPYIHVKLTVMKPTSFVPGMELPNMARGHVCRWLTCVKSDRTNNAIVFAHAYPGMLVFCNGSWFEFVDPHYKNTGKAFGDIESYLTLMLYYHFYQDMVVPF